MTSITDIFLLHTISLGVNCLFTLDALTGNVISKPSIESVGGVLYDNTTGNLYGLRWDTIAQTEYFVSINIATGSITDINSIPLIREISMGYPTFDEINRRYTFLGGDNNNNANLYTIDVTNGQVVYSPSYPVFDLPYNLLETEYDNSTGNLYALHWGPIKLTDIIEKPFINDSISIYPNPANDVIFIELPQKTDIEILNIKGQIVKFVKRSDTKTTVELDDLPRGIYVIKAKTDKKIIVRKFIKE